MNLGKRICPALFTLMTLNASNALAQEASEPDHHHRSIDASVGLFAARGHEGTLVGGLGFVGIEIPLTEHLEWRTGLGFGSLKRFPSGSGVMIATQNGLVWKPIKDHAFGAYIAADIATAREHHESVVSEGSIGLELEYRAYIEPHAWYWFVSLTPSVSRAMPFEIKEGHDFTPQISGMTGIGTRLTSF